MVSLWDNELYLVIHLFYIYQVEGKSFREHKYILEMEKKQ